MRGGNVSPLSGRGWRYFNIQNVGKKKSNIIVKEESADDN
jgi:hypothetical protein